jgi:type 1 glutamine amidotransferase
MSTTMKFLAYFGLVIMLGLFIISQPVQGQNTESTNKPIRLLIITGGHDFEKQQFFKIFEDNKSFTFTVAEHPNALAKFKPSEWNSYDVIVLYDMWQEIDNESKTNFLNCIKSGKGLVALHHCLASYQNWDEYFKLIGGRYNLEKRILNGQEIQPSVYKHDVKFKVHIVDKKHPVTLNMADFEVLDETYGNFEVLPTVHVLLTTDEPTSTRQIAWTHQYGKGKVVYIQLGHDHNTFENLNYRAILYKAINWVSN